MGMLKNLAAAAAIALGATQALAQAYPDKPVRVIISFTPGSSTDIVGRVVMAKVAEYWGQPVVNENRAGAGGSIGSREVAVAAPDGYTLLVNSTSYVVVASTYAKLPYDPINDMTGVALLAHPASVTARLDHALRLTRDYQGLYFIADDGSHGRELWWSDDSAPVRTTIKLWDGSTFPPPAITLGSDLKGAVGNRLYLATDSETQEVQVYDITDPTTITTGNLVNSYDLPGSGNARSIAVYGDNVFVGTLDDPPNKQFYSIEMSETGPMVLNDALSMNGSVLNLALQDGYAYAATSYNVVAVTSGTDRVITSRRTSWPRRRLSSVSSSDSNRKYSVKCRGAGAFRCRIVFCLADPQLLAGFRIDGVGIGQQIDEVHGITRGAFGPYRNGRAYPVLSFERPVGAAGQIGRAHV